ncbi:carboxypeptidase-like regulatory domain-containing protein [Chryseobacterium indoltheticum]|uniref:carboxypeptidase-like regulatory domain-containing protein n=1 Tax=Chryseobacterium indoltheticum TaxID=254 RepID=UPI003F49A429
MPLNRWLTKSLYLCPQLIYYMKKAKILLGLLFLGVGTIAYAQTTQASIVGKITGKNVQEKVKVAIVNESTGFRTVTETNSKGEYIFKEIPLGGPYTVIVNDEKRKATM